MRFTARLWPVGDATHTPINTWQETVDATLLQTLSPRGVFIPDNARLHHPVRRATTRPAVGPARS